MLPHIGQHHAKPHLASSFPARQAPQQFLLPLVKAEGGPLEIRRCLQPEMQAIILSFQTKKTIAQCWFFPFLSPLES